MVLRSILMLFIRIVVLIKCGFLKILKNFWIIYNLIRLTSIHSIKTYDFSTLYTTIPHTKLKARLSELNAFKCKNEKKRYEYIVVSHNSTYFVNVANVTQQCVDNIY